MHNGLLTVCTLFVIACFSTASYAAPLDQGEGTEKSRERRSEVFVLKREDGAALHSNGPELDEAEVLAGNGNISVINESRVKRQSPEMRKFLEDMMARKINCSIEFPVEEGRRKRRDTECKEDGGRVVCSAGGFKFVLDGGAELKRVRRFVEEVYGRLDKRNSKEEKDEDSLNEKEDKVSPREENAEPSNRKAALEDRYNGPLSEDEPAAKEATGSKKEDQKLEKKRESGSSTVAAGDESCPTQSGGGGAGGGGGGAGTECPTFRVYPPYFSTPCCRTTQSCPTKPCPVKPRPVMFITAPPPRFPPCPTVCCLGEPTCACQSTTCPTQASSTCHEHTCPLAGQVAKVQSNGLNEGDGSLPEEDQAIEGEAQQYTWEDEAAESEQHAKRERRDFATHAPGKGFTKLAQKIKEHIRSKESTIDEDWHPEEEARD